MFWNLSIHLLKTPLFLWNGWLRPPLLHLPLSHWPLALSTNHIPFSTSYIANMCHSHPTPTLLLFLFSITPLCFSTFPCLPKLGHSFRSMLHAPRSTDLTPIMLRFRPIAPKPVGDDGAAEQNRRDLTGKRVKRKYVRIRARQSKRRPKSDGGNLPSPPERSGVDDAPPPEKKTVTLQLLGERSEGEREICEIRGKEMRLGDEDRCSGYGSVMVTWIVMEGVTDKFAGVGLGCSDEEKMYNLERDTCPGFISDGRNNVIWVNSAYKRMVAEEKGFLVWLVVKEQLPQFCPSFACRVSVTHQNAQGQKWNKIVPCDVWKMEFAGFAWKLDVNTALSLGF